MINAHRVQVRQHVGARDFALQTKQARRCVLCVLFTSSSCVSGRPTNTCVRRAASALLANTDRRRADRRTTSMISRSCSSQTSDTTTHAHAHAHAHMSRTSVVEIMSTPSMRVGTMEQSMPTSSPVAALWPTLSSNLSRSAWGSLQPHPFSLVYFTKLKSAGKPYFAKSVIQVDQYLL